MTTGNGSIAFPVSGCGTFRFPRGPPPHLLGVLSPGSPSVLASRGFRKGLTFAALLFSKTRPLRGGCNSIGCALPCHGGGYRFPRAAPLPPLPERWTGQSRPISAVFLRFSALLCGFLPGSHRARNARFCPAVPNSCETICETRSGGSVTSNAAAVPSRFSSGVDAIVSRRSLSPHQSHRATRLSFTSAEVVERRCRGNGNALHSGRRVMECRLRQVC